MKSINCFVEFSPSFFFEERLEKGELTDEELIEVSKTFDMRVNGEEDDYLRDIRKWIKERVDDLSREAIELQKVMLSEVEEILIIAAIPLREGDTKVDGEHEIKEGSMSRR